MLGEHRHLLGDLLMSKSGENDQELSKMLKDEIKTLEDIQSKAKIILKKQSIRGGG